MKRLTPDYNKANACNILLAILSPHITALTLLIVDFARANEPLQPWIIGFWVILAATFLITVAVRYYYYESRLNSKHAEVQI